MTNTIIPHDHHHPRLHREREQQAPVVMKPPPPPQMTKKQARRRTHASRPYQERLLNMAEARREIVTALKIHRANMMRQQHPYRHHEPPPPQPLRQSPMMQLRRHEQQQQEVQVVFRYQDQNQAVGEEAPPAPPPTSYASFAAAGDPLAHWIAGGGGGDAPAAAGSQSHYCSSSPFLPYDLTPLEVPSAMGGLEQLARSLPAQPLGLNLSFQGFSASMDAAVGCDGDLFGGVPLIQSSSLLSPAASSYYSPEATEMAMSGTHGSPAFISIAEEHYSPAPAALILPVLGDGEMQSAGEATDVTAASAWWSKILLESMESGAGEVAEGGAAAVGCTVENVAAAASLPAEWRWLCDDRGVDEQGAVVKGVAEPPNVLETMLADDGDYYTFCYSDEAGRRGSDGITFTLPCVDDTLEGGTGSGSHAHHP